jgi:hypothetical protein
MKLSFHYCQPSNQGWSVTADPFAVENEVAGAVW